MLAFATLAVAHAGVSQVYDLAPGLSLTWGFLCGFVFMGGDHERGYDLGYAEAWRVMRSYRFRRNVDVRTEDFCKGLERELSEFKSRAGIQ